MLLFIPIGDSKNLSPKQKKLIRRNSKIIASLLIGFGTILFIDAFFNGNSIFYIPGILSVILGLLLFISISKAPNFK